MEFELLACDIENKLSVKKRGRGKHLRQEEVSLGTFYTGEKFTIISRFFHGKLHWAALSEQAELAALHGQN